MNASSCHDAYSATIRPRSFSDCSAASSRRTTRRPAAPSFDGCLALENAVDEISELELQRLGGVHFGRPHIARPIADQQIVDALAVGDLDALVVHLDLLVGLEVVPDEHLVAAANQRRPDLDRRQPVDVDVRGDVAWKDTR